VKRPVAILAAVAVAAALGGFLVARWLGHGAPAAAGGEVAPATVQDVQGQRRPDFTLADAQGGTVSAADFEGEVLLLNFWASWCQPCVEEMPMLSTLQADHRERGLRVVGIALDDPQRAQAFAAGLGLDYTLLYGRADAVQVGRSYGNRSGLLPYSALVDADGIVRWTHLGVLERPELEARLASLGAP
jgi:peroxiredoxin